MLVCIITNEELGRLHPAITRPGRCFAPVHVGRLSRVEAVAWLGPDAGVGADGASLAQLFELRGELGQVREVEETRRVGQYV